MIGLQLNGAYLRIRRTLSQRSAVTLAKPD
jgi:hypothetical protein